MADNIITVVLEVRDGIDAMETMKHYRMNSIVERFMWKNYFSSDYDVVSAGVISCQVKFTIKCNDNEVAETIEFMSTDEIVKLILNSDGGEE